MQIENKNWLGKNLMARGRLPLAQALGGRRKTKKAAKTQRLRRQSLRGFQFNGLTVCCPGFIPGIFKTLWQEHTLVNILF
jgi:hypothetical protein